MAHDHTNPDNAEESGQVLAFRLRQRAGQEPRGRSVTSPGDPEPADEFARYEQDNEDIDYRHRMLMNVIAIAVVTLLIGMGVWIADTIAVMQRDQDCVLQGRANCAPIENPAAAGR
jgi:hypothetical protein